MREWVYVIASILFIPFILSPFSVRLMSNFSDMLAADCTNVFLNTSEFAESLTYWSKDAPGKAVTITGVVHRQKRGEANQQYHRTDEETLELTVSAAAITNPQTGDTIRLLDDDVDVRHTFVRQNHRDAQMRVLEFKRIRIKTSGEKGISL